MKARQKAFCRAQCPERKLRAFFCSKLGEKGDELLLVGGMALRERMEERGEERTGAGIRRGAVGCLRGLCLRKGAADEGGGVLSRRETGSGGRSEGADTGEQKIDGGKPAGILLRLTGKDAGGTGRLPPKAAGKGLIPPGECLLPGGHFLHERGESGILRRGRGGGKFFSGQRGIGRCAFRRRGENDGRRGVRLGHDPLPDPAEKFLIAFG